MQELRFKIRGTESAHVEMQPCTDGSVDIVIKYGSYEKKPSKFNKPDESNIEILKNFCGIKKLEEGVDINELKGFYDFYEKKMYDWKGKIQPEKLWIRWMETAK